MVRRKFSIIYSNTQKELNISTNNLQSSNCNLNPKAIKLLLAQSVDLKGETVVIKLSADIINDDAQLANFSENVYLLTILEINVIIIHDYIQAIDSTLQLLGLSEDLKYKNNITSYRTTQIIEMVLVGHINPKIVSSLCNVGCMAMGISGKSANLIEAKKSGISYSNEETKSKSVIDLQFSTSPAMVNPEILISLEDANLVTVISPVSIGPNNSTCLLDVNITSSVIAASMTAKCLVFLTDFKQNIQFQDHSLSQFKKSYENNQNSCIDQSIVQATDGALNNYVERVRIINSAIPDALIEGLFNNSDNIIEVKL